MVSSAINDYNHNLWLFELHLLCKLDLMRTIVTKIKRTVWWTLVQKQPSLKKSCSTVVKLLCGVSVLRVDKDTHIPREERRCTFCNDQGIENVFHLIMKCAIVNDIREKLLRNIVINVSSECREMLCSLSDVMIFYIFMGLQFPFNESDLMYVGSESCVAIHKMYKCRKELEPP